MIEISFRQFYGNEHKKIIAKLEKSWINLHDLTEFAKDFGINDIFQDNGAKILQQLVYLNMKLLPGREGNDCVSASGREWEMKSINLDTTASGFSTNHHLTKEIIAKYRKVSWTFAIYHGISLEEIYIMPPEILEPFYQGWEKKLDTISHLNNPKIPLRFVQEHGIKVYPIDENNPIDPDSI